MSRVLLAFVVLPFFFVTTSSAQVNGRLTGTVLDASGASVPNATVSLYLTGGDTPILTAKTTTEGDFDFTAVRPEFYRLRVESIGFTAVTREGVRVDPGLTTSLPAITLHPAG